MAAERQEFPLRTSKVAAILVRPLAWGPLVAVLEDDYLQIKMGLLGGAKVPLDQIARVGKMRWPWWGGVGVRISKNMVAFVPSSGAVALIGLAEPIKMRAPLPWRSGRLAVGVEDIEGFIDEIAHRRGGLPRLDEDY